MHQHIDNVLTILSTSTERNSTKFDFQFYSFGIAAISDSNGALMDFSNLVSIRFLFASCIQNLADFLGFDKLSHMHGNATNIANNTINRKIGSMVMCRHLSFHLNFYAIDQIIFHHHPSHITSENSFDVLQHRFSLNKIGWYRFVQWVCFSKGHRK